MKIDLGKWAAILGQLAIAAPAVIAAVRPVLRAAKPPRIN